jgi:NitT/TauT family transport system substrate-binding protein
VALALVATLAGACSDDDDGGGDDVAEDGTVPPGPAPREPSEIADGCGRQAVTDPADLAADRAVARCGPGAPEAAPLPEPTLLRVAVPVLLGQEQAPILLAQELGEFEAENLQVELVPLNTSEAMAELAAGRVDAVSAPFDAPFLDAVRDGTGVRAVLGGALSGSPNDLDQAQAGMWLRTSALEDDRNLADLQGQTIGVPGGIGAAAAYPLSHALEQNASTLDELRVVNLRSDQSVERLRSGDIAAAWVYGEAWLPLALDAGFDLVATLPASESIDGTVVSERLLGHDRAVGLAFARAVVRTINTHLTGDFREDEDVVAALAGSLGVDEGVIADTEPLLYDWEIREGTLSRIEDQLIVMGGVGYDAPQDADGFVDRSLATEAVGGNGRR